MTTATFHHATSFPEAASAPRPRWFKRFLAAMIEARLRQAERELAMHRHLVPQDVVKAAGYAPTQSNDSALPFVR